MTAVTVKRLQAACFLTLLAVCGLALALWTRVEVDDVYIILRTAENLAAGHGMVFSPGDDFMPVTCPLWTMMLGLVRTLCQSGDLVEMARLLSITCLAGTAVLLFLLLRPTLGWASVLLAPMLLMAKEMPEHVGNEVGLMTCLVAGALLAWRHGRETTAAALVALCYLTRGEGVLLMCLLVGPTLVAAVRAGRLRTRLASLAWPAAVFAGIVSMWHLYHLAAFGSLMPKTAAVKVLQGHSRYWPSYGSALGGNLLAQLKHSWLFGVLFLCGLPRLAWTAPLVLAWAAIHVAFYSALRVPNYDWYYYPLFVVIPLTVLSGLGVLMAGAERLIGAWPGRILGIAAAGWLAWSWVPWPLPSANSERVTQYRAVASWLNEREVSPTRPLVMAFEIGIIGYYARSFPMIDPPGILVKGLTKNLLMDWHELIRRWQPGYLVFREALGPEVCVKDTLNNVEHRYRLVHHIAGEGYPQNIYQRVP